MTPKIRFVMFNDNWRQCKLDTIFGNIRNAFVGTATPYYVEKGHFYLESNNIKNGQINRNTEVFINDEFHMKQKDKWLHTGDLVMVQSGHVGHTAVIPEELNGSAAHALIMFSDYKKNTNPYFLNYQFQTMKSKKKLSFITTGNTIKHILSSEMKKYKTNLPTYNEQIKIGNFFKQLDNLIALQQQLLNDHKQLKKAMLQKMFPQKGESVPRVRFAGFTDNWEQRKLGEVSPLRGGFAFQSTKFQLKGIPIIRITNILSNERVGGNYVYYEQQENDSKYSLPDKSAILAMSGATTGKVSVLDNPNNEKIYQNQRVGYFKDLGIVNYTFISTIVKSNLFINQLKSVLVAGAQPNISSKEIDEFYFYFPTEKEEQTKIGDFFKQLDETIVLHEKKLETYQNLKKAMLQKMFV